MKECASSTSGLTLPRDQLVHPPRTKADQSGSYNGPSNDGHSSHRCSGSCDRRDAASHARPTGSNTAATRSRQCRSSRRCGSGASRKRGSSSGFCHCRNARDSDGCANPRTSRSPDSCCCCLTNFANFHIAHDHTFHFQGYFDGVCRNLRHVHCTTFLGML